MFELIPENKFLLCKILNEFHTMIMHYLQNTYYIYHYENATNIKVKLVIQVSA